jgi:aryl-alcohol dehydrogenase-like predicted oxidoreductase
LPRIHEALDAGVTLLDTGDYYGAGRNELLIRDALRGRDREDVVLSVKFGVLRSPSGEILGLDGRPAAVKNALGYTLTRLGTDHVDVYRRGLISGHWSPDRPLASGDFRVGMPRVSGENLDRNLALVERLRSVADEKGTTVAQLAVAWVLSRGKEIVPLVGARRRDRLHEALGALEIKLTADDVAAIERAVPQEAVAGDRYDARQMAILDSERGRA